MSQVAVPLEFRNVPVCFPNSHLLQTNREQMEIDGAGRQLKERESWEALLERRSQGSPRALASGRAGQQRVTPRICPS